MQTREKLINQERDRSTVYVRLADAFRQPGPDLPKALDDLSAVLARLESDAFDDAAALRHSDGNPLDPCALEVDYAGLFLGPFIAAAPPYGSVYLEDNRRLMGESTIDARHHYLSRGLDLSSDFNEPPDHICAELEFMHVLIMQGVEAILVGDNSQLAEIVGHQRVFLENHLAAWLPAFTEKVAAHANTGYYRNLAATARRFIAEEMEILTDLTTA